MIPSYRRILDINGRLKGYKRNITEYWWSMTGIFMQWRNVFRLPMDKDGIWVGSSSHIFYQNHCGNASSVRILWTYNHTTIFSGPNLTFKYCRIACNFNWLYVRPGAIWCLCESWSQPSQPRVGMQWPKSQAPLGRKRTGWPCSLTLPHSWLRLRNGPPPGGSWLVKNGHATMEEILWSMEVKRHNSNASGIDSIFSGWNHIHIELLIGKRQPVLKVCLKLADLKHDVLSLFSLLKFRGFKVILLASHDCTSAYVMRKLFYKEELWKKNLPESLRKLPCWHRQ